MSSASDRQAVMAIREKQAESVGVRSPESSMSTDSDSQAKPVVLITGAAGRIGTALVEQFSPG